jgi:hypothetical protein
MTLFLPGCCFVGTYALLVAHEIRVVIFEYHEIGLWKDTPVRPIVIKITRYYIRVVICVLLLWLVVRVKTIYIFIYCVLRV